MGDPEELSPTTVDLRLDLEGYINESDPTKRIDLAKEYLLNANAAWIIIYSKLGEQIEKVRQTVATNTRNLSEQVSAERELGKNNETITLLSRYIARRGLFQLGDQALEDAGGKDKKMEKLLDRVTRESATLWEQLEQSLTPGADTPTAVLEVLGWLHDKVETGDVSLLNIGDSFDNESHFVRQIAESSPTMGLAPIPDSSGVRGVLYIVKDLFTAETEPIDIILELAHERGHDLLIPFDEELDGELGDTHLIFQEFFAILEGARIYHMLPDELKKISVHKDLYDYDQSDLHPEELNVTGMLPRSNIKINFVWSNVASMLSLAYVHALQTESSKRRLEMVKELSDNSASDEEIQIAIDGLQKVTGTLLNKNDLVRHPHSGRSTSSPTQ